MPHFDTKILQSYVPSRTPALPEPGLEIPPSRFVPVSRKHNPYREREYVSAGWPRQVSLGPGPDQIDDRLLEEDNEDFYVPPVECMPGDEYNDTEIWRPLSRRLVEIYGRPQFPITEWPEWIVNEYYRGLQEHHFAVESDDWLARSRSQTIVCRIWLQTLAREDVIEEWVRLHPDLYYTAQSPVTVEADEVRAEPSQTGTTSEEEDIRPAFTSLQRQHKRTSSSWHQTNVGGSESSTFVEDYIDHDCHREQHSPKACRESKLKREEGEAEVREEPTTAPQTRTYRNFRMQKDAQPKSRVRFEDEAPTAIKTSLQSPPPSAAYIPLPPTPGAWPQSEESSPAGSDPNERGPDPAYIENSKRWAEDAKKHGTGIGQSAQPSPGAKEYLEKLHRGAVNAHLDAYRKWKYATTADRNKIDAIRELAEMRARNDVASG
ncbi:hypothetical protein CLAFUW4_04552 [Fulvia fulva]|uniref:Uncharacterized protein n=1 Tax=Passalora fulva TaxID=5499 RepID=A0A9Q8LG34_PASFU|nr:uncharacterized protein CLAFUR5_04514 [Fulvia fulva]KAK4626609.1 hypothetical protein CLAFUR4_04538 [Fulvia fulva]KAK4628350.1 hypothetical protein CLAFUR0_04541 [Fulvia fulva]UJO16554.1 hypothetical protein CLAFUR5_04514 [Fulvia fulva]WPV13240.1 hypothetical protein CLAFUW4_04552 [Fulvia fulva]WPV28506.1 hypothetical protein CLAFUW7_04544 [Fulvia fulva]